MQGALQWFLLRCIKIGNPGLQPNLSSKPLDVVLPLCSCSRGPLYAETLSPLLHTLLLTKAYSSFRTARLKPLPLLGTPKAS